MDQQAWPETVEVRKSEWDRLCALETEVLALIQKHDRGPGDKALLGRGRVVRELRAVFTSITDKEK